MTGAGPRRRARPVGAVRPDGRRRARRRRRLRARRNAADPARDPGARLADRSRDAAPRRDRRRPEAARDDRRRSRPPRAASRSARPTSSSTSPAACASTSRAPISPSRSRSPRPPGAPVEPRMAAFGEIGLTGRLRPATQADRRLEECAKLGLAAVVAPAARTESWHTAHHAGRDAAPGDQGRTRCRTIRRRRLGRAAEPELGFTRSPSRGRSAPRPEAARRDRDGSRPARAPPGDRRRHPLPRGRPDRDRRPAELSFLYSGGIRLDPPFRPQLLYELAKMDGAIIVDAAISGSPGRTSS